MQRIIQINIAGRIIPIEENAYKLLSDYINALERQFEGEEGKDEIIQDIEYRIAELFTIGLQNGAQAINKQDVQKVMDVLGPASEIGNASGSSPYSKNLPVPYVPKSKQEQYDREHYGYRRIYRDPYDKVLGGVCSGLAKYFDMDPTIVRLIAVVLFLVGGIGFLAYIIAWIVIPMPRTPYDFSSMNGDPMTFHKMARNMQTELQDLKRRGEEMSRELRDFFSKKK